MAITDWVIRTIEALGYGGIAGLMFLENLFPPIPSELIMPLAGFTVSQGDMRFGWVVVMGTVGTVLGTLPWYALGRWLGSDRLKALADRYGHWITLSSEDITRSEGWFAQRGAIAVLLCRLVPGIRTWISVPAGTYAMPLPIFLLYSTVGTLLWVALLTYAGFVLGSNYDQVKDILSPISRALSIALPLLLIGWIWRRYQRQSSR